MLMSAGVFNAGISFDALTGVVIDLHLVWRGLAESTNG